MACYARRVLTARSAAALLSASGSIHGLTEVARAIGLERESFAVDDDTRAALGLETICQVQMGAGPGAIRYLVVQLGRETSLRDALHAMARRLASRSPHVLWLVLAVQGEGSQAGIVAWSRDERALRLTSFLWEPAHVVDSDAETLCALASVPDSEDLGLHARWTEILGRDALSRRFYRILEGQVGALAASLPSRVGVDGAREIALLYTSRLLFLRFLEAKGWLNAERSYLTSRFDDCMRTGGQFHRRVLLPLFFGTLNTPPARRAAAARALGRIPFLNGGLFAPTAVERRLRGFCFSDEAAGALFSELFQRFRFVAREDTATWSEASVDPEMLGRAFESLMASGERRSSGVYYTPHALVGRAVEEALAAALGTPSSLPAVRDLRVLDPACGSGAFLVSVLERLAGMRRDLGDGRPVSTIRRDVLARSVFGVDRNPIAVWLCELRLWLSVVIESEIEDPERVLPLPNLDRNIRVGDALAGAAFAQRGVFAENARIAAMQSRYMRATGARKQSLARTLDRAERARVLAHTERALIGVQHERRERLAAQRAVDLFGERPRLSSETRRDLKHLRDRVRVLRNERRRVAEGGALPFSFGAFFADAQSHGGFDVVLGNPPWVRLHRIPAALRLQFKRTYEVYRSAPWAAGAEGAGASPGFASQVDLAALFVERGVSLLRPGGALSFLVPVKLWRSLAGGGLRQFLMRSTQVIRLDDLSEARPAFDAAAYPSLLVVRLSDRGPSNVSLSRQDRQGTCSWSLEAARLPFDASAGAPWLVMTPEARAAFDRVRASGSALASTPFGSPRLGVKSGCNAAFVVRVTDVVRDLAHIVDSDGERGTVEVALLRPALRGEAVVPWSRASCTEWIVWTHDAAGAPLQRLPERARAWLRRRYDALTGRTDAARSRRWWSLFRVDAADSSAPRVVWADFGKRPRALVLPAGDPAVPLNTCYVLRCRDDMDAWALAALLNSRLAAAWLNALAEPARGGYRRYLAWTVGLLPLPSDWQRARAILAGVRGADDAQLLDAALDAYRVTPDDVKPLLEWPG
ncbi:MAG: Eco57I restriction-modification methylase domain-containing protein [Gemmatimonadaceae bacterium]